MTMDAILRIVERETERLEREYVSGAIDRETYEEELTELEVWSREEFAKAARLAG